MSSRYKRISKEEMENFFKDFNLNEGFKETLWERSYEYVYSILSHDKKARIIIFSSIDKRTNRTRDVGKDAIRVLIQRKEKDSFHTIKKFGRVLRIQNWKENLRKRINQALDYIHPERCPFCNDLLVRRVTRENTGFYGCYSWPKTKCKGRANDVQNYRSC